MNKTKLLSIVCTLSLLFTACGSKTENSRNQSDSSEPVYIHSSRNCYDDGMIYYNNKAMYYDYATGESTPLCAKPNCSHTVSGCVANIVGECPVMYNDYLYFFNSVQDIKETGDSREFYIDSKLCRVSLDSSEVETVAEFTDSAPHECDGCVIYNNELYFTASDMNPQTDDYGMIYSSTSGGEHYICGINLKTGEYTNYGIIYDGDKQYEAASHSSSPMISGFYDGKIYINYSFCKEAMTGDESAQENFDPRDYFTLLCFEFDPETKEIKESSLSYSAYADKDSYVYYDSQKDKSVVIDKGKTYEFDCDVEINASFINNKLFNFHEQSWYDLSDMPEHSMGEYGEYHVVDYYDKDKSYILTDYNGKIIKLTEEELP